MAVTVDPDFTTTASQQAHQEAVDFIGNRFLVIRFDPEALHRHALDEELLEAWLMVTGGRYYLDLEAFAQDSLLTTEKGGRVELTEVAELRVE